MNHNNGQRPGERHKMKTYNFSTTEKQDKEIAKTIGTWVNIAIAIAGAIYCIYGIWLQASNNL